MSDSKNKTIVCLHGNSSSSKVFEKAFKNKNLNYNFLAVDLPGHGSNQNVNLLLEDFSLHNYQNYLLNELESVEGDVLLIGNSLGGHLAIEVAEKLDNLKGIVIFGTPPVKRPLNFLEAFTQTVDLSSFLEENPDRATIKSILSNVVFDDSKLDFFVDDFFKANPKVRTATKNDLMGGNFADEYSIFTNLDIPKYIIIGEDDPTVNHDYIKLVNENSKNNCELIYFENCGHYPSYEKPEEFFDVISKIAKSVF